MASAELTQSPLAKQASPSAVEALCDEVDEESRDVIPSLAKGRQAELVSGDPVEKGEAEASLVYRFLEIRLRCGDEPYVCPSTSVAADLLELAGSSYVIQLSDMMGRSLARRVIGGDALSHEIGRFGELVIAEASAVKTPLVGKTLAESGLGELVDVSVVGVWDRGEFQLAEPETLIGPHTSLVLAGT